MTEKIQIDFKFPKDVKDLSVSICANHYFGISADFMSILKDTTDRHRIYSNLADFWERLQRIMTDCLCYGDVKRSARIRVIDETRGYDPQAIIDGFALTEYDLAYSLRQTAFQVFDNLAKDCKFSYTYHVQKVLEIQKAHGLKEQEGLDLALHYLLLDTDFMIARDCASKSCVVANLDFLTDGQPFRIIQNGVTINQGHLWLSSLVGVKPKGEAEKSTSVFFQWLAGIKALFDVDMITLSNPAGKKVYYECNEAYYGYFSKLMLFCKKQGLPLFYVPKSLPCV